MVGSIEELGIPHSWMKHIMRVKNDGVMRDDVQIDFITFTDVLISSENVWSILSPPRAMGK